MRIRARLVRARDGYGVWSESYTRQLDDVFAVQEEIAREVVAALEVQLRPPEEQRLARRPTEDFEAYELYLRGRFHWNQRSVPGLQRGMELFRQALEETLDRGPQLTAYLYLGLAHSRTGAHERAIQVLREGRDRYPAVSTFTGLLGYAYARAGRPDDARGALEELRSLRAERPVAAIDLAVIHVGLGETEAALDWIERGYEERNWQVRFLGTEPAFDPLRSEARFRAVLEDVGAAAG